jgi:DNA-binding XRE family transcriptional regulator
VFVLLTVCCIDKALKVQIDSQMRLNPAEQKAFYEEVGRRIRSARLRRKPVLTQEDLGKEVGLTRTSITNVEKGRQKVPIHTLVELANVLRTDLSTLLPLTEPLALAHSLQGRPKIEKDWILNAVAAAGQTKGMK